MFSSPRLSDSTELSEINRRLQNPGCQEEMKRTAVDTVSWHFVYLRRQEFDPYVRIDFCRIHGSVEDTKLSTNKQHTLSGFAGAPVQRQARRRGRDHGDFELRALDQMDRWLEQRVPGV